MLVADDVGADFDALGESVGDSPSFFVFCFEHGENEGEKKWILVAYVPESAPVRAKMLYASSREDVRKALSLASVTHEYYACEKVTCAYQYHYTLSHSGIVVTGGAAIRIVARSD